MASHDIKEQCSLKLSPIDELIALTVADIYITLPGVGLPGMVSDWQHEIHGVNDNVLTQDVLVT